MPDVNAVPYARDRAAAWVFWAAACLAIGLVTVKAVYLAHVEGFELGETAFFLRSLAAISFSDVLFAAALWAIARALLAGVRSRPFVMRVVAASFAAACALLLLYAVINAVIFGILGGFLTYPLLSLVGDVRMLRSSVAVFLTARIGAGLVAVPLLYGVLVALAVHRVEPLRRFLWPARAVGVALILLWVALGQYTYATEWRTRSDRRIADNSHELMIASWWQTSGDQGVRMTDTFEPGDLADFEPIVPRTAPAPSPVRRTSGVASRAQAAGARPFNVIFIVLESVGARWASLNPGLYPDTTPTLKAESQHGLVFDNFYAHIGRSSNSLAAMLLSTYPKLDFRDITEQYPHLPGTSLPSVFHDRGYRTAFFTPSDLNWAGWGPFLSGRGFDELRDYRKLPCTAMLSSWGVEDRCMVDGMIDYIAQPSSQPFFLMGWTQQTHHPYEPTPNIPMLDLVHEKLDDTYDLERYLNVLHETDRHLGRLFDAIRGAGLENNTIVVVTGDHGQAFGYPHDGYMQGRNIYEEDVHVPLLVWAPRLFPKAVRSNTIGGHVDLAPTIAGLAGLPAAQGWQGRALVGADHPPRAYFYVAEDDFKLGVREDQWKYTIDLREGSEELFDLNADGSEQHNVAAEHQDLSKRLRQRLAAWTEANRRQYQKPATTY